MQKPSLEKILPLTPPCIKAAEPNPATLHLIPTVKIDDYNSMIISIGRKKRKWKSSTVVKSTVVFITNINKIETRRDI